MSKLKIVSWNCHYGFDGTKLGVAKSLDADILVVPECRKMDMDGSGYPEPQRDWYGDGKEAEGDPQKDLGIGVFVKDGLSIQRLWKSETVQQRYVLPYRVSLPNGKSFTLFAVWTKGPDDYLSPIYAALDEFKAELTSTVVLIGDFNTGSIYGKANAYLYEGLQRELSKRGFVNCASYQEWVPTFFRGPGSWLDDHCFVSDDASLKVVSFGIGNRDYWRQYSDHCPIIVDFELEGISLPSDSSALPIRDRENIIRLASQGWPVPRIAAAMKTSPAVVEIVLQNHAERVGD
jgi:endonuclease/exonuclease/phosphatase family metal-dependent hydrolase